MRTRTVASALFLSIILGATASYAKSQSLIGSWRGGGVVQPKDGAREKTRCRAEIQKSPGRCLYHAVYRCSSPLGLISQTVDIKKKSTTRYVGTFYNPQYNVKGTFSITLQGNRHSVVMKSSRGEGWIDFSRK